ncbi:hypothetical protein [Citrobacter europaeus]|uniref:hypothetical protein n=1 Tax=Citrobacter europaeus TaxID=1914243 RepID=UPI001BD0BA87|nr:hypothetical protein [Citrobacter europaeus]
MPNSDLYPLPPHLYRDLVNALFDTSIKYQNTQQLRAKLSSTLLKRGIVPSGLNTLRVPLYTETELNEAKQSNTSVVNFDWGTSQLVACCGYSSRLSGINFSLFRVSGEMNERRFIVVDIGEHLTEEEVLSRIKQNVWHVVIAEEGLGRHLAEALERSGVKPQRVSMARPETGGLYSTRYFNPWAYVNMAAGEALMQRRLCLKHVPEIENVGIKIFRRLNENGQWRVTSLKDIEASDYAKDTWASLCLVFLAEPQKEGCGEDKQDE